MMGLKQWTLKVRQKGEMGREDLKSEDNSPSPQQQASAAC